jgi:GxxExxY protein
MRLRDLPDETNAVSHQVLAAAFEVHTVLGPGLSERFYTECLTHELRLRGIQCEGEKPIPVVYKGKKLGADRRADLVVEERVIVEIKSVETLLPVHEAQLMTYLRLTGIRLGILLNFNVIHMRDGFLRRVL